MPLITKYFKGKSFRKKRKAVVEAVNDAYTSTARAVVPKKLQYEFGVDDDTVALTKDKRDHETEVEQKHESVEAAIKQADREPDPAEVERFLKEYDSTFDDCPGPPGRLSALSVFLCKSVFYGAFVWARRALNIQKRRLRARAVTVTPAMRMIIDHEVPPPAALRHD